MAVRQRPAVRRRSEHGEVPRFRVGFRSGRPRAAGARRLRIRARVRCRTLLARSPRDEDRAGHKRNGPELHRSARTGAAEVLLMQFEQRYARGIADGSINLTFRRWKRSQALAGNTYRTAAGRLVVDTVDVVEQPTISDADAQRAGYPSAAALVADLLGTPEMPVYRVAFHPALDPDPRDELASSGELSVAERSAIETRLHRLDRASPTGPWTGRILDLI